jgi:hypothetical protein
MRNKMLNIALLIIAAAVTGFFILHAPSPTQTSSRESAAVENSISAGGTDGHSHSDKSPGKAGTPATMVELQEVYARISENPDYPELQTRLDAMQTRHRNRSFEPQRVVETMAQSEAWVRLDGPPEDLPLTSEEKFDGREYIRFNPLRIEALMAGDTLEIPIWQLGVRYTMRVDSTETHPNGSVTWHGHLEDFTEPHRATITVGNGLSLGGIDTPRGHYVLQANGESGWIASSETLFKRNESETDMVIPPAE